MNNEMGNFEVEKSESIWKIDGPIGRLDFFWGILISIFFALPAILLNLVGLAAILFPVCIILIIISCWLIFAAFSKRFYDITGQLKWGVIIAILLYIINIFLPIITPILLIIGLAVPGKLLTNTNDDD